jgi:hypothetical protein
VFGIWRAHSDQCFPEVAYLAAVNGSATVRTLGPLDLIGNVRRLGRSGGATHPAAPAKLQHPDFGNELSQPEFAFLSRDGYGPYGSSGRILKVVASDGVRSPCRIIRALAWDAFVSLSRVSGEERGFREAPCDDCGGVRGSHLSRIQTCLSCASGIGLCL